MRARIGDRLVVGGRQVGSGERVAEVIEVHGSDGAPPYLVRWLHDGHESLLTPGSDVTVQHGAEAEPGAPAPAASAESHLSDTEVRLSQLEESLGSLARQVEELRESLRALASVSRDEPPAA